MQRITPQSFFSKRFAMVLLYLLAFCWGAMVLGQEGAGTSGVHEGTQWENCQATYEKILDIYTQVDPAHAYAYYTKSIISLDAQGEVTARDQALEEQLWVKEGMTLLENEYVKILQDQQEHVMVLKKERIILVRKGLVEEVQTSWNLLPVDSIAAVLTQVKCWEQEDTLQVDMHFTDDFIKKTGLRQVEVTALQYQKKLLSAKYLMGLPAGQMVLTGYQYHQITSKFAPRDLPKKALQGIFDKEGKLLPAYTGFLVRDLREQLPTAAQHNRSKLSGK